MNKIIDKFYDKNKVSKKISLGKFSFNGDISLENLIYCLKIIEYIISNNDYSTNYLVNQDNYKINYINLRIDEFLEFYLKASEKNQDINVIWGLDPENSLDYKGLVSISFKDNSIYYLTNPDDEIEITNINKTDRIHKSANNFNDIETDILKLFNPKNKSFSFYFPDYKDINNNLSYLNDDGDIFPEWIIYLLKTINTINTEFEDNFIVIPSSGIIDKITNTKLKVYDIKIKTFLELFLKTDNYRLPFYLVYGLKEKDKSYIEDFTGLISLFGDNEFLVMLK